MRSIISTIGFLAVLGVLTPAQAIIQCQLTGVPVQMRGYGLAEQAGDIVLRCAGGTPFAPIEGTLQVAVSSILANQADGVFLNEVMLALDVAGAWHPIPGVRARRLGANSLALEEIHVAFDPAGTVGLRVSGIRVESGTDVMALVSAFGNPQLPVPFATVIVGRSTGLGLGAASTATIPRAAPRLPDDIDFEGLLAAGIPFVTTRITETSPAVLRPKGTQHESATRVVVTFAGVPKEGRVLVPRGVAGSNAIQATSAGNLGTPAAPGLHLPQPSPSLMLGLVTGADSNGLGGVPAFDLIPGMNLLGPVGISDERDGLHYAVYEVLDANNATLETAQFPAWIVMPTDWREGGQVIRSSVSLGPVSEVRGVSESAPVPRFAANMAINDCPLLNDCAAPYFPHLRVTPISPTEFTAPSGAGHQIGNVIVENTGGNLLEWRVRVRYEHGADWVRIFPEAGVERATVRFDVLPGNLTPGDYTAQLVVTGLANAGEVIIPVLLRVTMPLPPVEPPPVIHDVVNAGNRIPGPVAPGSLAVVLGEGFTEQSTVTAGGIPARVLLVEAGQILIEIPPALDPGLRRALVQVDRGGRQSVPWGVEIAPVAPAVLFALNEDDNERNGPDFPVATGRILQLFVTGLGLAVDPVFIRLHDREIEELLRTDGIEEPVGAKVLRFVVPEDLPAMATSVLVCGRTEPDGELACGQPLDITLKKP